MIFVRLCPIGPDSWCRFRKAEAADTSYLHTNSIPEACMEVVKPCFDKLATVENVRALQHDFSTDHNEAFNSTIWAVDGKSTFSSQPAVQFAADLATLRHNLGWEETSKRIYSEMKLDLPKERILIDRKSWVKTVQMKSMTLFSVCCPNKRKQHTKSASR